MRRLLDLLKPITHPVVVSRGDLARYVARVSVVAVALALFLDVGNQMAFFTDWSTAIRSWTLTVIDSGVVAVLIAIVIGRAQRDLQAAKRQLETLSLTDAMTGLPNRRAIMDAVATHGSSVMVLVILDIDRFKSINDGYGHRTGDSVIGVFAHRMAADLRNAHLVGRLGGEEFAVLCSREAADEVLDGLERFRQRQAAMPIVVEGVAITVTVSAGAAVRDDDEQFDRLYTEADAALYEAKNAGRNCIALSPRLQRLRRTVVQEARSAA